MTVPDAISRLLDHVGLRANTFYAGPLCGLHDFAAEEGVGHLHVIRGGQLTAAQSGRRRILVREPTLLFYPRPVDHRLDVADQAAADVLCASVRYDAGLDNAITQALPTVAVVPFRDQPRLGPTLALLFDEAAADEPGRQVMLDRLCDVLLVQVVRHALEHGQVTRGVLAGLAHPRLGRVLVELLDHPARPWTLESMAARASLSRNAFARRFREVVGETPADFLTRRRIAVAQRLLRHGRPLGLVVGEVGYNSQPAFSRAFIREVGVGPSVWLRRQAAA